MLTMKTEMTRAEFIGMASALLEGDPKPGHKNEKLGGLSLANFEVWDEWFTYGMHERGVLMIYVNVTEDNATGIDFLKKYGFTKE